MKKYLIRIIAFFCAFLVGVLLYKTVTTIRQNNVIALNKYFLPAFTFYSQRITPFNSKQVAANKAVCIFYYNADCEYCQDEAKHLQQHIGSFNNVQILMVSTSPPAETQHFADTYKLSGYKNIIWLYDKNFNFYKWFGNSITPSVFIYNRNHTLVKAYKGEVKIEAILKYIVNGQ
jgi:peroxiredoxin